MEFKVGDIVKFNDYSIYGRITNILPNGMCGVLVIKGIGVMRCYEGISYTYKGAYLTLVTELEKTLFLG